MRIWEWELNSSTREVNLDRNIMESVQCLIFQPLLHSQSQASQLFLTILDAVTQLALLLSAIWRQWNTQITRLLALLACLPM